MNATCNCQKNLILWLLLRNLWVHSHWNFGMRYQQCSIVVKSLIFLFLSVISGSRDFNIIESNWLDYFPVNFPWSCELAFVKQILGCKAGYSDFNRNSGRDLFKCLRSRVNNFRRIRWKHLMGLFFWDALTKMMTGALHTFESNNDVKCLLTLNSVI